MTRRSRRRHGSTARHLTPRRLAALFAVAVVLLIAGVFTLQALQARAALAAAAGDAELLQDQIVAGDVTGARGTLGTLQRSSDRARSVTGNVLWDVSARIPFLGRNADAIQTVSRELDRVADTALPPVVDVAGQVNAKTFSPDDGAVDVKALAAVSDSIGQAARALSTSRDGLADVDASSLLAPLRGPVSTIQFKVDSASSAADNADLAAQLLPNLLGADGTRRLLLLNQNNAEIRSGGGIVGSYAVITARKGRITLGQQGSIQDMPPFADPVVELTKGEKAVFPTTLGSDIRNVTLTPDFPRTAVIARAMVEETFDVDVDGVVSVDPVALSYLLGGTGAVEVDGFPLDQNNAVATLLHQVYRQIPDPDEQDDYFERSTKKIFNKFRSGDGDPTATVSAFARGVEENRIAFWSAKPEEQAKVSGTPLAGELSGDAGDVPHVGVYLNDAASTKMEYFLDQDTAPVAVRCLDGGHQVITTTTTLSSTAPADAAKLPKAVTGIGDFVKRGSMRVTVRLFSPFGGEFTSLRLDGEPLTIGSSQLKGRTVARAEVVLKPGESHVITASSTSGAGQTADPVVSTTPGIESQNNDYSIPSACTR